MPSQGPRPRHTKDVIKMVPVVPLFSTEHSKGKIMALSQDSFYGTTNLKAFTFVTHTCYIHHSRAKLEQDLNCMALRCK